MTEKLYYKDAYIKEFTSEVISCERTDGGYLVVLSETAFFPEEGGQYSDRGTLSGASVLSVSEKDGVIYHLTDEPLPVGSTAEGKIDFDERFEKMQCHTAEHILSGLIHSTFGYSNVGFHLGADEVTMDISAPLCEAELSEIERRANEVVFENVEVEELYPSPEELSGIEYRSKLDMTENVRIVKIGEYDSCACCAPHVSKTGQIGMIKLISCMRYKGGTRIHLKCGFDALDEFNDEFDRATAISNMISEPRENIAEGVKKLLGDINEYKHEIYELKKKMLSMKIDAVKPKNGRIVYVDDGMDMVELRSFVNAKLDECEKFCIAFSGNDEDGYTYVLGYRGEDFNEFVKNKISMLGQGGGGGKPPFAQGKVKCKKSDIDTLWLD